MKAPVIKITFDITEFRKAINKTTVSFIKLGFALSNRNTLSERLVIPFLLLMGVIVVLYYILI